MRRDITDRCDFIKTAGKRKAGGNAASIIGMAEKDRKFFPAAGAVKPRFRRNGSMRVDFSVSFKLY
jgi:hypothetical protein